MTMEEKVARALAPLAWAALGTGDTLAQENRRKSSLRHARAAIEAMEPTEEMLKAGTVELSAFNDDYDTLKGGAESIWNAMRADALTPAKTGQDDA